MLRNYHSHCTFCDGRSYPEAFVRFAIAKGFRAYGFSSHAPLPFETAWNMHIGDMPEYLAEIDRLKKKYEGQIEIYTGLEIDYLTDTYHAAIPYFKALPLDYRIGSIHYIPQTGRMIENEMLSIDGSFKKLHEGIEKYYHNNIRQFISDFYLSSMNMVDKGGFDIVGHADKVYMNMQRYEEFSFTEPWYQQLVTDYFHLIAEKGLIIEVNTKNLTRKGQTFPHIQLFPLLKHLNIPIQVNSDCHFPDLVNDGREEALKLLKEAGIQSTRVLSNGSWQDIGIQ